MPSVTCACVLRAPSQTAPRRSSSRTCSTSISRRCLKSTRWRAACQRRALRAGRPSTGQNGGTFMNRKMLMKIAVSGFALGITATGCSGTGPLAVASLKVADKAEAAAKSADRARAALEKGKAGKAVSFAEAAVAASPRDAGYRALLGQAYLSDGRFASAEAALGEAMELGARDANTLIALTLAYIARGNSAGALALLKNNSDVIPASDAGLALALAGDSQSAIYVLTAAARAPDASARTRQNLALAFALSGRWAQARILASQDLSPAKIEGRMTEWAKLAEARDQAIRVASLIGAKAKADAGMPVQLAL